METEKRELSVCSPDNTDLSGNSVNDFSYTDSESDPDYVNIQIRMKKTGARKKYG